MDVMRMTGLCVAAVLLSTVMAAQAWTMGNASAGVGPARELPGVHLASYRSVERAEEGWTILRRDYPHLLDGLPHVVRMVDLGPEKGIYFRLLAGPFDDEGQARELLEDLRQNGAECSLRRVAAALPEPSPHPGSADNGPAPSPLADALRETESIVEAEVADSAPVPKGESATSVASVADQASMPAPRSEEAQAEAPASNAATAADSSGDEPGRPRAMVVKAGPSDRRGNVPDPPSGLTNPFTGPAKPPIPTSGPVLATTELSQRVSTEFGAVPAINGTTPSMETFTRLNMDMGDVILSPQLNVTTNGDVTPFAGFTIPF